MSEILSDGNSSIIFQNTSEEYRLKNLGPAQNENVLRDIVELGGGSYEHVTRVMRCSYSEYIVETKSEMDYEGTLTQDDLAILNNFQSEADYNKYKSDLQNWIKEVTEIKYQAIQEMDYNKANFDPHLYFPKYVPFKKILNGNFDKLDKKTLSFAKRVKLKVDDLPEEMWDIFYDSEYKMEVSIYYDFTTVNEYFVKFGRYLKELKEINNIKGLNFKLPLILFDRDLLGVDTHSSLSSAMIQKVYDETVINPIYHFRENARFLQGNESSRFQMTIGNWTMLWLYCQGFNIYHEAPRQTGKTFMANQIMAYEYAVGSRNIKMATAHFKAQNAKDNRKEMIGYANLIPDYLRFHALQKDTSKKSKHPWRIPYPNVQSVSMGDNMTNIKRNNIIKALAIGKTETTAEQAGRGATNTIIHFDELNFIVHIEAVLTALQLSHSTARVLAEKDNKRCGMIYTSTAGKLNTKYGRKMYKTIYKEYCMFDTVLFGYSYEDINEYMVINSSKRFFVVKYAYDELGFDELWLEKKLSDSPSTPGKFETEILQKWLDVDENSLFTQEAIARCRERSEANIEKTFMFGKYYKFIYSPAHPDDSFEDMIKGMTTILFGLDIAAGNGDQRDATSLTGACGMSGKPRIQFNHNNVHAVDLHLLLIPFFKHIKSINPDINIIINVERNAGGAFVLPHFIRDPEIEPMLYKKRIVAEGRYDDETIKIYERRVSKGVKDQYGSNVDKTSRYYLTELLLMELIDKYPYAFDMRGTFDELSTLGRKGNKVDGRIEAKSGCHDDNIFSMLHAYSLIFDPLKRPEVEQFFGFRPDFQLIKALPLKSSFDIKDKFEGYYGTEGTVSWKIIQNYNKETGERYETINVYKVENGRKRKLEYNEFEVEVRNNKELLEVCNNLKKMKLDFTSGLLDFESPGKKTMEKFYDDKSTLITKKLQEEFREQQSVQMGTQHITKKKGIGDLMF